VRKIALILLLLFFMPTSLVAVKHFKGIKTDVYQELMKSCVAQWKMNDDTNSTVVVDSSGNGYNGTAQQNTEDINAVGKIGGALTFNGTSDYIDTNNTFQSVFRDSFSINLWVKVTDGIGSDQYIFSVFKAASYDEVAIFKTTAGELYINYYANAFQLAAGGSGVFVDGQNDWKMITVIATKVSATTGNLAIYVNGSLLNQSDTGNIVFGNYTSDLRPFIGAENYNGNPYTFFKGSLDNVMIFDKAISQAEIDCLWNGGAGREE
jgi:hypothetical protein